MQRKKLDGRKKLHFNAKLGVSLLTFLIARNGNACSGDIKEILVVASWNGTQLWSKVVGKSVMSDSNESWFETAMAEAHDNSPKI